MNSRDYWQKREEEQLKHYLKDEAEYDREIKAIYQRMLDSCQEQIDSFYGQYASREGISIAEAKKRVSSLNVKRYERKAKRYVREKNFSKHANDGLRLYNATMKINRLEMLKANIGLELISGHDELEKYMAGILQGRTMEELQRQAGILGKSVRNNAKTAHAIVNSSFQVAKVGDQSTFSDRIWQYQDLMREDLGKILQTALIQGKNPRAVAKDLKKYWYGADPRTGGGATYCMERLMRTELARVQTEAQKQSFERNEFDDYMFISNEHGNTCKICNGLDGKHFKVKDMMPGLNAPPMHPHCRCSTAAWVDDEEYEEWLEFLDKGGTTAEWEKMKAQQKNPMTREEIKQQITDNKNRIKDIEKESLDIDQEINRYNLRDKKFAEFDGLKKQEIESRIKVIEDRLAEIEPISNRYYNRPERGTDEYTEWREWRRSIDFFSIQDEQMRLSQEHAELTSKMGKWKQYEEWLEYKKTNPLDRFAAKKSALADERKTLQNAIEDLKNQLAQLNIPKTWKKISGDHDNATDIKAANPNYSKGREYKVNCQRCVPTYEMRRRGYDVTAKPNLDWDTGDYLSRHSNEAFMDADVHWGLAGTGKRDIERLLKEWGNGARAEVGVSWKGAHSGHVFVAENVDGKIIYIDPQSGEMDVSYYFKSVRSNTTRVWRIDNLNPSELIANCCE